MYTNFRVTRTPCVQYVIFKEEHILFLIHILQGKILLSNKQKTYTKWVEMYNACYNTAIIPLIPLLTKPLPSTLSQNDQNDNLKTINLFSSPYLPQEDKVPLNTCNDIATILKSTSWLSGLIDAEGCFSMTRCDLKVSQNKSNNLISKKQSQNKSSSEFIHKHSYILRFFLGNKDELHFYNLLSEIFFNNVKVYTRPIKNLTLISIERTLRYNSNGSKFISLINYLRDHPLKSRKRIAYSYWLDTYKLLILG